MKSIKSFQESVQIQRLAHDGRGVAEIKGKTAFVFGGLPGEQVLAEVYRQQRRYYEASVVTVEAEPASTRVSPKCSYFGLCGGCRLQHMEPSAQQEHKLNVLLELLAHVGRLSPPEIAPILSENPWGYRHKARLGLRYVPKKGGLLVGFRERKSNKLTSLDRCEVLAPSIGENLAALRVCFDQLEAREHLSQIEVAVTVDQTALILRHLVPLSASDQQKLIDFAQENKFCIYLQSGGPDTVKALWPSKAELLHYDLVEQNLRLQFEPLDFTQVNPVLNQKMVSQALAWLAPDSLATKEQIALDLFCGIGNFSLAMATIFGKVIGFEGGAAMVARATANAAANKLSNVAFHVADLSKAVDWKVLGGAKIDAVLLDPPRSGAQELIPALGLLGPKRIVYVSCNPSTFARDAGLLVHEQGYKLLKVGIMDMFAHTEHSETMGLFIKS